MGTFMGFLIYPDISVDSSAFADDLQNATLVFSL